MAPQYTQRDLAWYGGMMLGMAGVYTLLEMTGVVDHRIAKLVISGLCGLGCGFALTTIFDRSTKK
jgi:hypothetical protein